MALPNFALIQTDNPANLMEEGAFRQAANLVFTQDALGQYLSFYWSQAEVLGLDLGQIVGTQMNTSCGPISFSRYLSRVRWVLDHLKPDQFCETFCYCGKNFEFEITLSPILLPQNPVRTLLVLGKPLEVLPTVYHPLSPSLSLRQPIINDQGLNHYQPLFSQISWNIRRTLDLETIWQQTVNGLGNLLNLDRCLICNYNPENQSLKIVASYQKLNGNTLRGTTLQLLIDSEMKFNLQPLQPLQLIANHGKQANSHNLLGVITSYQDCANGLILMEHEYTISAEELEGTRLKVCEEPCFLLDYWSIEEQFLIRELADQVGTAIAHAHLYNEAHSLADELQSANLNLTRKHLELEEARKQAEEASRLKSDFLANTSHELRTPLNGIIGFLKLLLDDMADSEEEKEEFLTEAHRSALLLLAIINDILDIAKLEANRLELELHPINLSEVFADVGRKTATQAYQKGLAFDVVLPATQHEVVVYSDYQRLLQIILNLVGNAIKFTDEGSVTLKAKVKRQPMTVQDQVLPGYVQISVEDTGIGVPLEKQTRLFQAFSQVDSGRTRKYGGTGLGLVISQKLVEAMHGSINFFSLGEGLGSTVTVTIPLFQDPGLILAPPPQPMPLGESGEITSLG
jgi:signal transduction histidine kinase